MTGVVEGRNHFQALEHLGLLESQWVEFSVPWTHLIAITALLQIRKFYRISGEME